MVINLLCLNLEVQDKVTKFKYEVEIRVIYVVTLMHNITINLLMNYYEFCINLMSLN